MAIKKVEWKSLSKFAIPWTLFLFIFTIFLENILNPVGSLERKWFDLKFNIPRHGGFGYESGIYLKPDPKINIIAIDEFTTEKYGWPFKRRYYALLLDKLNKYGVKSIAMDVMFIDPDRENPENDKALISSLKKYNNVVNLVVIENYKIKKPIKGIIENSRYMAQPHADVSMDGDGHIRSMYPFYPPVFLDDGTIATFLYRDIFSPESPKCEGCSKSGIPLLGMAAYAIYKDIPLDALYLEWKEKTLNLKFRFPEKRYKHQGRKGYGKTIDNEYYSPFRNISVRDVIEDTLSSEEKDALNGGVALVGATALGAFDHYPNPFRELTPGVEFHATLIDNMIKGDYLRPVSGWVKLLLIILAVWLPIVFQTKSVRFITVSLLLFCFTLIVFSVFSIKYNLDMNFISYFLAIIVSYIYVMSYKSIVEGREKKWIKNTFSQYLSPKVVNIITEDPSKLILGGEKRDMTICFMDIAGFTSMSERLSPEELTRKLNYYLSELTDIILKYDGVVDKYIGDCIMAFWNAPIEQKNHRTLACKAAIDCIRKLKDLNKGNSKDLMINMRVGINSGQAVVGNMGSKTRLSYTVIGDNVNLASRLEGANKFFHSRIMVSKDVYDEASSQIYARFLGSIRVVGKVKPVDVYEPICHLNEKDIINSPLYSNYENGIKYFYNKEYARAAEFFSAGLKADDSDGPCAFYLDLSEKCASGKEVFEGVFNLTSK